MGRCGVFAFCFSDARSTVPISDVFADAMKIACDIGFRAAIIPVAVFGERVCHAKRLLANVELAIAGKEDPKNFQNFQKWKDRRALHLQINTRNRETIKLYIYVSLNFALLFAAKNRPLLMLRANLCIIRTCVSTRTGSACYMV